MNSSDWLCRRRMSTTISSPELVQVPSMAFCSNFPSSEGLIVENWCADISLQRNTLEMASSLENYYSESLGCNFGDKSWLPVFSSGVVSYLKPRSCAPVYRTFGNRTPIHLEPRVVNRHHPPEIEYLTPSAVIFFLWCRACLVAYYRCDAINMVWKKFAWSHADLISS